MSRGGNGSFGSTAASPIRRVRMAASGATSPFTRALTKVGSPHLCRPPSSRRYDLHPDKPPEGKLGGDDGDEGGQRFGKALEILGKTPVPLEKHAQLSVQVSRAWSSQSPPSLRTVASSSRATARRVASPMSRTSRRREQTRLPR